MQIVFRNISITLISKTNQITLSQQCKWLKPVEYRHQLFFLNHFCFFHFLKMILSCQYYPNYILKLCHQGALNNCEFPSVESVRFTITGNQNDVEHSILGSTFQSNKLLTERKKFNLIYEYKIKTTVSPESVKSLTVFTQGIIFHRDRSHSVLPLRALQCRCLPDGRVYRTGWQLIIC